MFWRVPASILLTGAAAFGQNTVHFVGFETNAKDDQKLISYMHNKTNLPLQRQTFAYSAAVRHIADWDEKDGPYIAHMTPYAYVAAEMLGAKFTLLATYSSKRSSPLIYHSYFVVNKADANAFLAKENGEHNGQTLTLENLPAFLRFHLDTYKVPAKFIYHDKFSTSSYFLPSLYFRSKHVFAIEGSLGGSQTPIQVEKTPFGTGSSFLVQEVAGHNADLAAVWDETKDGASESEKEKVYFIPLDTDLPNDLLVASTSLDSKSINAVLTTIRAAEDEHGNWNKPGEEIQHWMDIRNAPEALDALGELRRLASMPAPDVTIDVRTEGNVPDAVVDGVRDGVRLSGTEFVLYQPDFHKRVDVTWKLRTLHDGALEIFSTIEGVGLSQHFHRSFKDRADLTTRIANLVQFDMDRIRYVWPYEDDTPSVIRDLDFTPEKTVKVERIIWTDQDRNEFYEEGSPFDAEVVKSDDSYKLQLTQGLFPRGQEAAFRFEPMSNAAYRVVLQRPSAEAPLFAALTGIFVGTIAMCAFALFWDLRRKRPAPSGFLETRQRLIDDYHRVWSDRAVQDTDLLWCDPKLDEVIDRFRSSNPISKEVEGVSIPWIHVSVGAVVWLFRRSFGDSFGLAPELVSSRIAGDAGAVERLVKVLVRKRRLSLFTGKAMEWDALDRMVRRNFRRLGIGHSGEKAQLRRDSPIAAVVSRNFQQTLPRGKSLSLFHCHWDVTPIEGGYVLGHEETLGGELQLALKEGPFAARTLQVECKISAASGFREALASCHDEAWLLGEAKEGPTGLNGSGRVRLEFSAVALLKPVVAPQSAPALNPSFAHAGATGD